MRWVLFSAALAFCFPFTTWSAPTHGPEFEFGSKRLIHFLSKNDRKSIFDGNGVDPDHHEANAVKEFVAEIGRRCEPECTITEIQGKWGDLGAPSYEVKFPDGYWLKVTPDPWCVEILQKPMTLEELKSHEGRMQNLIFDVAKTLNLTPNGHDVPWVNPAAGHFNFGLRSTFGDDGKAFLRFYLDYSNFPELASGTLGRDFINAPPLARLRDSQRAELEGIIHQVNQGELTDPAAIAGEILDRVYTWSPYVREGDGDHYQAIGLKYAREAVEGSDRPAELRALRMQNNAREFIQLAELVELRAAHAKNNREEPLVYLASHKTRFSKQELAEAFYIYVTEAGGNYDDFKSLQMGNLARSKISSFLTGMGDWYSRDFAPGIHRQLERAATSPWVREKLFAALSDPASVDTGQGLLVVRELIEKMNSPAYPTAARAEFTRFLESIAQLPHWKSIRQTPYNSVLLFENRDVFPEDSFSVDKVKRPERACESIFGALQ